MKVEPDWRFWNVLWIIGTQFCTYNNVNKELQGDKKEKKNGSPEGQPNEVQLLLCWHGSDCTAHEQLIHTNKHRIL